MESVDKELAKPEGSMCDECKDVHADTVNLLDMTLIEECWETLPEELRTPNTTDEE